MWRRTTSKQGTAQADPTSMGAFAHWIFSLLQFLLDFISVDEFNARQVPYVDEFTVVGKLSTNKDYWSQLTSIGPKYVYFQKALKSYLIVKEDQLLNATALFVNSNVNIVVEEKRHFLSYCWEWQL